MLEIKKEDIILAYQKLKTYVYHDSTELFMRHRIVEFETDLFKDNDRPLKKAVKSFYEDDSIESLFSSKKDKISLDDKFSFIEKELQSASFKESDYFKKLIEEIEIRYLPKKIDDNKTSIDENFISNELVRDEYAISQFNAFIDMPVELHIISILWIMKFGYKFDSELLDESRGNRLVLQKDSKETLKNSSLFKPYHHQYQKWRDDAVNEAEHQLKQGKDIVMLNLDITRFFYNAEFNLNTYFPNNKSIINDVLREVYRTYIDVVVEKMGKSFNPKENHSFLPIGELSAYVIANHYLNDFDRIITEEYRPLYYGRYVDDMLIVLPRKKDFTYDETKFSRDPFKFEIGKYKKQHKITNKDFELTKVEEYIAKTFNPLFIIESDQPDDDKEESKECDKKSKNRIVINTKTKYHRLKFQSEKTLLYEFFNDESTLTIDKLKHDLLERSSEFRDLPEDNDDGGNLEKVAHHLIYSDSEGKVRTLKDYKVNRYGLSVYLTNKILATINYKQGVDEEEVKKLLQLVKGENILIFFKLWEKILTFLLVNKHPRYYIRFYFDAIEAILRIKFTDSDDKTFDIQKSLIVYLDIAHEITLSLHPKFLSENTKLHEEFKIKKNISEKLLWVFDTNITDADNSWIRRYRVSNMMRHHYIATPLLNYTNLINNNDTNLLSHNLNFQDFKINKENFKFSPRQISFWELAIAKQLEELQHLKIENNDLIKDLKAEELLNDIFDLYQSANKNHQTQFQIKHENPKNLFFSFHNEFKDNLILEISNNTSNRLSTPKIGIANTKINTSNIASGLKPSPNLSKERYNELTEFLKDTRKLNADIVVFPEFFVPFQFVRSLAQYAKKNQSLVISGLEHYIVGDYAYNFVLTLLPIEKEGYKDVIPIFRLKNHYAPSEIETISKYDKKVPKPKPNKYHLINWRNIYFSTFYCFELADIQHRSAMRSKVDILFMIEYNRDTNYFSNIVESTIRDIHCYAVQCNSSDYGDTRISQPTKSVQMDIVNLKGGENNVTVIGTVNIDELREFQLWGTQPENKQFKPLPPDFDKEIVNKRVNNKYILPLIKNKKSLLRAILKLKTKRP